MKKKFLLLSSAILWATQTPVKAQEAPAAAPVGPVIATPIDASQEPHRAGMPFNLDTVAISRIDRSALSRVAYAEAGNQGDAGLAAVVFVVLNRVACGHFGPTVQSVINAPGQFEPVSRAGGTWRNLPPLTAEQQARFDAIFNLIFSGFLPDPTNGALFFQNPAIVAARESNGQVSAGLTNFGGLSPIATIKDHAFFYSDVAAHMGILPASGPSSMMISPEEAAMFAPLSGAKDKTGKPESVASDGAIFIALETKEPEPEGEDKTTKLHAQNDRQENDQKEEGEAKTESKKTNKKEIETKNKTEEKAHQAQAPQQIATGNTVPQQTLFVPINSQ